MCSVNLRDTDRVLEAGEQSLESRLGKESDSHSGSASCAVLAYIMSDVPMQYKQSSNAPQASASAGLRSGRRPEEAAGIAHNSRSLASLPAILLTKPYTHLTEAFSLRNLTWFQEWNVPCRSHRHTRQVART